MNVEEFVTNNYIRFYKAKYILKNARNFHVHESVIS